MTKKTLVAVPAFNCEIQIARVLKKLLDNQEHFAKVIVLDNKSTDATFETAKSWIQKFDQKLIVRKNEQNYNLGGTLKIAFETAISENFERLIVIHGDDQADFRDLIPYLGEIEGELSPELIIGARFHKDSHLIGYSIIRRLGNLTLNKITQFVFRVKIEDMIAGLNMYSVEFLKKLPFRKFPDDLTFDSNTLFWSLAAGKKPVFIPITWRDEDQVTNAKVVSQAIKILKNLLLFSFKKNNFYTKDRSVLGANYKFKWTDFE